MADIATIARPYAEALSKLATDADLANWSDSLSELAQLASNTEVASLATNPNVATNQIVDYIAIWIKD
jgi:F-type H+-transporting ATPase subunit delta